MRSIKTPSQRFASLIPFNRHDLRSEEVLILWTIDLFLVEKGWLAVNQGNGGPSSATALHELFIRTESLICVGILLQVRLYWTIGLEIFNPVFSDLLFDGSRAFERLEVLLTHELGSLYLGRWCLFCGLQLTAEAYIDQVFLFTENAWRWVYSFAIWHANLHFGLAELALL